MGTRGSYGFRKNGIDKLTYNHFDSYPDYLGRRVVEFCKNHTIEELNKLYDKIVLVNERNDIPNADQIKHCVDNGWCDLSVSNQSTDDWYCLLRNIQGDLEELNKAKEQAYMIDNHNFIKDSLWCEYAYIINLDDKILEFYEGFQKTPQEGNRYGFTIKDGYDGYYPCKLSLTFPLNEIDDVARIVEMMDSQ